MILLDGKLSFCYEYMGLFHTDSCWIHPTVTIDTYELIYVTQGEVCLKEGATAFVLHPGDAVILSPGTEHGGTQSSNGITEFYWIHFRADPFDALHLPKRFRPDSAGMKRELKMLLHLSGVSLRQCELALLQLLFSLSETESPHSRLAFETAETLRIHAREPLTVAGLADRLGYHPDYLSRVYKKEFGTDLKTAIISRRLTEIDSLLLNTHDSVKAIGLCCGFEDDTQFVKFYKYHKKETPSAFRNRFSYIHMNNH